MNIKYIMYVKDIMDIKDILDTKDIMDSNNMMDIKDIMAMDLSFVFSYNTYWNRCDKHRGYHDSHPRRY